MTRYKNERHEQENQETDQLEQEAEILKEPAKSVEDEVWKKRYGDQQRYLNQIKADTKAQVDELKNKLDQALRGQLKAPKTDEDVEAWVKEYPEFAGILETIVRKRINEATSSTTEKLSAIEDRQRELDREEAVLTLKKMHPDLDELTTGEDFHKWLRGQRTKYQDAIYKSLDIDDADFVISKYKAEMSKSKSKVDDDYSNTDAAKVVRKQSARNEPIDDHGDYDFTESQIERESKRNRKWYDQNETKIMDAIRKGRVLYDVSGGAR